MPDYENQQVLQQLLTGMNTMQMQAGLMPGGTPALHSGNIYEAPRTMTPAEFSNNLSVNLRNTFSYMGVTPPMYGGITPVPRTNDAAAMLPPPIMGGGWGAARQQAIASNTQALTGAQALTGFGARAVVGSGIGAIAGAALGGPVGFGVGLAADYLVGGAVEKLAQMPFKPLIDQQTRALQLQNMSMFNVRRGPDLSASGIGLSTTASMDLERNLMRMSDNRNFRRDTGNMFNRQDMMRITEISSQVGLLDNAQSVEQISREMGKIGRALSTFMKVVEEPDVRRALQMMGNMRNLGMNVPEMNVAAANARVFARMAGTTVQGVMQAGMQGANMFQQYGLSGATGLNVGMAATGVAGNLATTLDPRTAALLGGREGIAQSLTGTAAQMSQMDVFLPGFLKRGKDGALTVDQDAIKRLAQGKAGNIQDMVRSSAARLAADDPRKFIEEFSTRKSELQDQLMNQFGGMGSTLYPLLIAQNYVNSGAAQSVGAALRGMGIDEKRARTLELLYKSPNMGATLRQQMRTQEIEQQRARAGRSAALEEAASDERYAKFGRDLFPNLTAARRYIGNYADAFMRENFGQDTDLEEQQNAAGGGRFLRVVRPGALADPTAQERLGKQFETTGGVRRFLRSNAGMLPQATDPFSREIAQFTDQRKRLRSLNPMDWVGAFGERVMQGPAGVGITDVGRGGENIARTVYSNEDVITRTLNSTAVQAFLPGLTDRDTPGYLKRRLSDQMNLGRDIEQALNPESVSGVRTIATKYKIQPTEMAKAMGAATKAVKTYFADKQTTIGPFAWHTGQVSQAGLDQAIRKSIESIPNLSKEEKDKLAREMRVEVIRSAGQSMTATEKQLLDKLAKGGADLANASPAAVQQTMLDKAEAVRAGALNMIGVETGAGADMTGVRAIAGVFTNKGLEGVLQQKYLAADAMDRAGLTEQAAALRTSLEFNDNYTDKQRTDARKAAGAAVENISNDQLRSMGEYFGQQSKKGRLSETLGVVRQAFQERATGLDFAAAGVGLLGTEGYQAFRTGAQEGKGVEALRKALREGKTIPGITEESLKNLTDEDIAKKIQGNIGQGAKGVVAGGLTQLANQATEEQRQTEEMINTIERGKREGKSGGAAAGDTVKKDGPVKFNDAVEIFASASTKLAQAAEDLSNSGDISAVRNNVTKAAPDGPVFNQAARNLFGMG